MACSYSIGSRAGVQYTAYLVLPIAFVGLLIGALVSEGLLVVGLDLSLYPAVGVGDRPVHLVELVVHVVLDVLRHARTLRQLLYLVRALWLEGVQRRAALAAEGGERHEHQ